MNTDDSDSRWPEMLTASQVRNLLLVALDVSASDAIDRASAATTPLPELESLKDAAKQRIRAAADDDERESARLLYHVAVASALVHHRSRISGRPLVKQQPVYRRLAESWEGHPLGTLFAQAAQLADTGDPEPS